PFLKEKGVCLLGTDAPSVDAVNSKTLRAHHALYQNNVSILENVVLHHVEPGDYELIALPLAIHGADGSRVRAVIRPLRQYYNFANRHHSCHNWSGSLEEDE